ncbi:MAG TPA: hypothetical protein VLN26_14980, partial [Gaiellaceae bacterium]|nr:hypothetical protein [Gaiellaceae bacterium]
AVGGWKNAIPGLDFASSSRGGTNPVAIAAAFSQAAPALAAYYSTAGSYSGADALHEIGPTGLPQPGLCPAGI